LRKGDTVILGENILIPIPAIQLKNEPKPVLSAEVVLEQVTGQSLKDGITLYLAGNPYGKVIFTLNDLDIGEIWAFKQTQVIRMDRARFRINGTVYEQESEILGDAELDHEKQIDLQEILKSAEIIKPATLRSSTDNDIENIDSETLLTEFRNRMGSVREKRQKEKERRLAEMMEQYHNNYNILASQKPIIATEPTHVNTTPQPVPLISNTAEPSTSGSPVRLNNVIDANINNISPITAYHTPIQIPLHRIEEGLLCNVCNKIIKEPRFLACFHSFCTSCLLTKVVDNKITCTDCTENTSLLEGGITSLKEDTRTKKLVQLYQELLSTNNNNENLPGVWIP